MFIWLGGNSSWNVPSECCELKVVNTKSSNKSTAKPLDPQFNWNCCWFFLLIQKSHWAQKSHYVTVYLSAQSTLDPVTGLKPNNSSTPENLLIYKMHIIIHNQKVISYPIIWTSKGLKLYSLTQL